MASYDSHSATFLPLPRSAFIPPLLPDSSGDNASSLVTRSCRGCPEFRSRLSPFYSRSAQSLAVLTEVSLVYWTVRVPHLFLTLLIIDVAPGSLDSNFGMMLANDVAPHLLGANVALE